MAAIVYVLWRTLKMMPQTKPVQIKPQANQDIGWEDIAGVDEAKDELREVVEFLRDPSEVQAARRAGSRRASSCTGRPAPARRCWPRPSRTSPARSSSRSRRRRSSRCSPASAPRASGACSTRRASTSPRSSSSTSSTPSARRRGSDNNSEREQTLNQLLVEMDGFSSQRPLVVMAASNLLEKLDPALLRPGRFDRQVFVSPPDVGGRAPILEVHTRNKPLRDDVDLGLVAQQTSGLTGADLANICNEAAIFCARRGGHAIAASDFDDAIERVIAGVQSSTTLNEHERRVVAYHEAGHALCRELLPPGVDRVHKISIVPRGRALGYVVNLPDEDSYLKTREELVDQMTVLLGGRVAEQIVFGDGHDRRGERPPAGRRDHPRDDPRVRDGLRPGAAGDAGGRRCVSDHLAAHPRRGAARARLRGPARRLGAHRRPPRRCSSARPGAAEREVLERPEIDGIMDGVAAPGAPAARCGERCASPPPSRRAEGPPSPARRAAADRRH